LKNEVILCGKKKEVRGKEKGENESNRGLI
jgi:hypothetical protein